MACPLDHTHLRRGILRIEHPRLAHEHSILIKLTHPLRHSCLSLSLRFYVVCTSLISIFTGMEFQIYANLAARFGLHRYMVGWPPSVVDYSSLYFHATNKDPVTQNSLGAYRIWANQPIHSFLVGCLNFASKEPVYGLVRPSLRGYSG